MSNSDEAHDGEVGYGRPPKATRFKPGQSGNPKGRPKKTKDFDGLIENELNQTLLVTEGGESRRLTKRELIVNRLVGEALKGNKAVLKVMVHLMKSSPSIEGFEPDPADKDALLTLLANAGTELEPNETMNEEEKPNGKS